MSVFQLISLRIDLRNMTMFHAGNQTHTSKAYCPFVVYTFLIHLLIECNQPRKVQFFFSFLVDNSSFQWGEEEIFES